MIASEHEPPRIEPQRRVHHFAQRKVGGVGAAGKRIDAKHDTMRVQVQDENGFPLRMGEQRAEQSFGVRRRADGFRGRGGIFQSPTTSASRSGLARRHPNPDRI